jgi:hypothetical protein
MFSKIPQKLTAPFGLLGDEAKLSFRSQPTGILKLTSTRVRPASFMLILADFRNLFIRTSLKTMHIGTRYVSAIYLLVVNSHGGSQYIQLFDSASDVFSLITPHDSRARIFFYAI